jgi:predicted nucleic acid-binding protein
LVPGIWPHELPNGLGKGVVRGRLERPKAFLFWREIRELPVRIVDVPTDETRLELALQHNLAVYDASYLRLALTRNLPIATADAKLQNASASAGIEIIKP